MRIQVDGAKIFLLGCIALTWTLTACVGEVAPSPVAPQNYEVLNAGHLLERGMISTKIVSGTGEVVFNDTYNARDYNAAASIQAPSTHTLVDSLNIMALGAFLTGKGNSSPNSGLVTFTVAGRSFSVEMLQRGAKGEGKSYRVILNGDTTVTITTASNNAAQKNFVMKAGSETLYSGSSLVGQNVSGGASVADLEGPCGERFALISAELTGSIFAMVEGFLSLDPLELVSGFVIFLNAVGNLYLWIIDDCYNTFMTWLHDFWVSNCLNPLFSWTPFCEEE